MEIENSSVLNIKGGLFGDVKWNTNLNEAPFETPVLVTERFHRKDKKGSLTIGINSRVRVDGKGDNCWWSYESHPIAWSPIPIYNPESE